jgi:hypothetical protein
VGPIARFGRLDRHQKAFAGFAWDAGIGAQLKIGTTAGFDQGQPHPLATLQARNFGGLKMGTGWGWHDAPSELGGSAILSVTDGSRDGAVIGESYTFIRGGDTFQFEQCRYRNQQDWFTSAGDALGSSPRASGLFVLSPSNWNLSESTLVDGLGWRG